MRYLDYYCTRYPKAAKKRRTINKWRHRIDKEWDRHDRALGKWLSSPTAQLEAEMEQLRTAVVLAFQVPRELLFGGTATATATRHNCPLLHGIETTESMKK